VGTHILFQFKLDVWISLSDSVPILEIGDLVELDSENRHFDVVRSRSFMSFVLHTGYWTRYARNRIVIQSRNFWRTGVNTYIVYMLACMRLECLAFHVEPADRTSRRVHALSGYTDRLIVPGVQGTVHVLEIQPK
jgi:hypothetical protein